MMKNGYLRPRTKILNDISGKVEKLQEYLGNENFSQYNQDMGYWYSYITQINE